MRRAEIIAVGTELTCGATVDTNSQWLSTELNGLGVLVQRQTTVADEFQAIVDVLRESASRTDLVVMTGGLGPTLDDLTRDAIAEVAGAPLELHEEIFAEITQRFERMGRVMSPRNRVQAFVPRGAMALPNPRGTAPGLWCELPRRDSAPCQVIALPGVPSEMKPMFLEEVRPRLPNGTDVIRQFRVHVFGLGESAVEERLGELTQRGNMPEVGITAHDATITLRILATGPSPDFCEKQALSVKEIIRQRLGDLVFGEEDDELQDVVVRLLQQRRETLAVVETPLSGGQLTEWLSRVDGVDKVFRGGLTAISLDIGLSTADQMQAEAAIEEGRPARMLAEAYRASFNATWGLAIVGGRNAVDAEDEGMIAVVGADCVATATYRSYGDIAIDRSRSAKTALDLLRRRLLRTS